MRAKRVKKPSNARKLNPLPVKCRPEVEEMVRALASGSGTLPDVERLQLDQWLRTWRIDNRIAVRQPLALITPAPRSGGALLNRLLDGHPACWTYPWELRFETGWRGLSSAGPGALFWRPAEPAAWHSLVSDHPRDFEDRPPTLFLASVQRTVFLAEIATVSPPNARAVLDAYWTSYFNAWLDHRGRHAAPKRWITGFAPEALHDPELADEMFAAYPDGRIVSIVREPRAWWAASRGDLDTALRDWVALGRATLDVHRRYGERMLVLRFDELVADTETTMRRLARALSIEFLPCLLRPTYNGLALPAGSSLVDVPESSLRLADRLSADESNHVQRLAQDVYEQLCAVAVSGPTGP